MNLLPNARPARLDDGAPPALLVVVDTEEEFAWGEPFRRDATSVRAIASLHRVQRIFDEFGVRPVYVVDYPVATTPESVAVLRAFRDAGRASIGAHLHPWVNPPHEEEVTFRNSFPGNLDPRLERAKIRALADAIEASFGFRPTTYKAGRYGLGPHTAAALDAEGFEIDLSVCAHADLRDEGGPDFRDATPEPLLFGTGRTLLELPTTAALVGPLWRLEPRLRGTRLGALLGRLGAFARIRLSPEGVELPALRRATEALARRGVRVVTLSFHSPSVEPGCTAYVRDAAELSRFLDTCRRYLEWFLGAFGGAASTPEEIRARALAGPAAA